MVADKGKKPKIGEKIVEENEEQIDGELVLSIEKLQEVQDELEKVLNCCCCLFIDFYVVNFEKNILLSVWNR